MVDTIANGLSKINNASASDKNKVVLKRSKFIVSILKVLKKWDYAENIKEIEDNKQGLVEIELKGTINKCGAIKPRFPIKVLEMEKYERKYLPAKDFGILLISTNKGVLTQSEAKEKNIGGSIIAYCY
jgi:small subunit ribosomal protein S8